jgi:hypothetical protein
MTKNPIINALVASLYIFLIVAIMTFGTSRLANKPDTFLAPIAMVSLFTLSAAVMGYLFLYQPIQLYFDNKKKTAVKLFLQTVGVFGIITILTLISLFLNLFH